MSDKVRILASLAETTPPAIPKVAASSRKAWSYPEFLRRLESLGGKGVLPNELHELSGRRAWVDADAEEFVQELSLERVSDIWEAEVGFTMADAAICESGSLLLAAGPGRRRMASLAPEIHVCFVRNSAICCTLEEALERLSGRTSVLITGSSRTADIEGVLVRGVHGPKEVWVVLLPESTEP